MVEALAQGLPDEIERLAERAVRAAGEANLALVTAESCTGGLLASLLTDIPGFSHAFERGFVTYATEAKTELLGVSNAILTTDGPVSRAAAVAMAEGALARSRGDIAVSITGYCEADPSDPRSEAGLCHFACVRRGGGTVHLEKHFGALGRARIRHKCLEAALSLILQAAGENALGPKRTGT